MKGVVKTFPGVKALTGVDFEARKREVHALAGENGAGKSTLIKILSGAYTPDEGEIFLNGKPIKIRNPHEGRQQGISVIYQEMSLVPHISVAENIFLSRMPSRSLKLQWKEMNEKALEVLRKIGFDIDPTALVKNLSVVEQQAIEIARVLVEEAKIVVMDEPTALLPSREVSTLFREIETLRRGGITVIYISHRLDEIFTIADRVTVLKDGAKVGTVSPRDINKNELIQMMIGRKPMERILWEPSREEKTAKSPTILEVENIQCDRKVRNVSFNLRKGEILGIAGLVGSGKSELVQSIFGGLSAKGVVKLKNKTLKKSPASSIANGIGFLPADRRNQGLVTKMTVEHNVTLASLDRISKTNVINSNKEKKVVLGLIDKLKIACYSKDQSVKTLSGGNQQKTIIARWLLPECEILIFDEPTRGIDVGARAEIYKLMAQFVEDGGSIIVVSSDLQELLAVCDRIIVMGQGRITGEFKHSEASEDKIVKAMF
jgi:ribose transport system ATP-binding protein